jgi:hypothetical protein
MATKAWHLPVRLATGLFILNEGLTKQQEMDAERAKTLHGTAAQAFPQVEDMEAEQFVKVLSTTEIALGAALVAVPVVPPMLAGLGLLAFAGGLNRLYLKIPGLRRDSSVRPTQQGVPLAKDVWMTAIGAALVLDSIFTPKRRR